MSYSVGDEEDVSYNEDADEVVAEVRLYVSLIWLQLLSSMFSDTFSYIQNLLPSTIPQYDERQDDEGEGEEAETPMEMTENEGGEAEEKGDELPTEEEGALIDPINDTRPLEEQIAEARKKIRELTAELHTSRVECRTQRHAAEIYKRRLKVIYRTSRRDNDGPMVMA